MVWPFHFREAAAIFPSFTSHLHCCASQMLTPPPLSLTLCLSFPFDVDPIFAPRIVGLATQHAPLTPVRCIVEVGWGEPARLPLSLLLLYHGYPGTRARKSRLAGPAFNLGHTVLVCVCHFSDLVRVGMLE